MSEREQKLEAALRKVIDASTEHLMHGTDITIFCNQVLDVVTQQELCEALATPPTSEWNEAIEAAEKECLSWLGYENSTATHNDFAEGTRAGLKRAIESIRALKRKERT